MLSERSQTQKATYCMILFIEHSRKGKHSRNGEQINRCQELGVELEGLTVQEQHKSSFSWGGKDCVLIVLVVTHLYALVKTHGAGHQKE